MFDRFGIEVKFIALSFPLSFLINYLVKFYWRVKRMPPGPTPLPVVGNAFALIGIKKHIAEAMIDIGQKYGPVFAFWAGREPFIFITDLELGIETFKKNEFSGRPKNIFTELYSNDRHTNILFADYGPAWESLRRVAHAAVRKYSDGGYSFACLIKEIVEETVIKLKTTAEINGKSNPSEEVYFMMTNIMNTMNFGFRFTSIDDPDFKRLKYSTYEFFKEVGVKFVFMEFFPFLRPFFKQTIKKMNDVTNDQKSWIMEQFLKKKSKHQPEIVDNFCDALIAARNEMIAKGKAETEFLTDINLSLTVFDLFIAGTLTTQDIFRMILLLMATYPEMQVKMRQEIESVIGDRMPIQEDRNNCHYVNAFISETMRFRNGNPVGAPHKTMCDTKIGKYDVPKNTMVFVLLQDIQWSSKYWPDYDPKKFVPERFLVNGNEYVKQKPLAFVPFSVGRRACIGEKIAMADLFLITANFLQATSGYEIALPDGPGSVDLLPEPKNSAPFLFVAKDYEIIFQKTK